MDRQTKNGLLALLIYFAIIYFIIQPLLQSTDNVFFRFVIGIVAFFGIIPIWGWIVNDDDE